MPHLCKALYVLAVQHICGVIGARSLLFWTYPYCTYMHRRHGALLPPPPPPPSLIPAISIWATHACALGSVVTGVIQLSPVSVLDLSEPRQDAAMSRVSDHERLVRGILNASISGKFFCVLQGYVGSFDRIGYLFVNYYCLDTASPWRPSITICQSSCHHRRWLSFYWLGVPSCQVLTSLLQGNSKDDEMQSADQILCVAG